MWLSRCCEKKLLWRRAGDAGGGWCQLPSPPGQQSHWSEHSDELCQRPQCQIFQCTIVFQCTSHTVLMRIEQSTLLFLCGEVEEHWGSFLLHLPTKVEEGNAKWQRRSSLLSTSHLLSGGCAHVFGTNRVCPSYQSLRSLCHFVNIRLLSHFLCNLHNILCLPLLLLPLYISDQFKRSLYFCSFPCTIWYMLIANMVPSHSSVNHFDILTKKTEPILQTWPTALSK